MLYLYMILALLPALFGVNALCQALQHLKALLATDDDRYVVPWMKQIGFSAFFFVTASIFLTKVLELA